MDYELVARKISEAIVKNPKDAQAYGDLLSLAKNWSETDFKAGHDLSKRVRGMTQGQIAKVEPKDAGKFYDVWKSALLFDAPCDFDCYAQYIELDRQSDKRFYLPRRKQLLRIVKGMQRLADGELDLLAVSLPPGVGKTTLALFLLTWLGGRNPEKPMLTGSHSNAFLRGAYDECIRIIDPQGEYLFKDVFPDVQIVKTNAQDMMVDLGGDKRRGKRFATFEFSSVGSGNAGKVRAEQLLYCDDLVADIQQAMSKERLDLLWEQYTTDLRQRKIGECKELHIATRWSVHDVIGRLEQRFGDSDKAEFIVVPALNENDESNFDYGNAVGFTTKMYHEQREIMDDASWKALFMNEPIEREGQLYDADELRRYFELPDGEPDAILSLCDTKDKGTDYCFMPILYQYGNDFYLEDVVLNNGNTEVIETMLVEKLIHHKVHMSRFESNKAGWRIAEAVQKAVKEKGGKTKITTKATTTNKETKIIVNSPWVKEHVLFKDDSVVKADKTYRKMLQFLCSYTMAGKNKNDDVPDGLAMFAEYAQSFTGSRATVINRPW